MNRDILFRGKRIDNGEWVEGSFLREKYGWTGIIFPIDNSTWQDDEDLCIDAWYRVDNRTVCQYTGLTDKNGRKIFEGDIVAFTDTYSTDSGYAEGDCIGEVVWDEEEVCFHVTERLSAESWEVLQECCVIGNIFDNPELLEGGAE